jgi:hypothetical protein
MQLQIKPPNPGILSSSDITEIGDEVQKLLRGNIDRPIEVDAA